MTVNDLLEAKDYKMVEIDSLGGNWQVEYKRIDYGSQASVKSNNMWSYKRI